MAQSLGVSVPKVFAMSWAISAVVSSVAGVVVGVVNGVSSALSFYGIKVFPAVILGGLDSVVGAVLGGLIYTAGVFVFISQKVKFRRAIWHGFVVTGAGVHWAAVLIGVVLVQA